VTAPGIASLTGEGVLDGRSPPGWHPAVAASKANITAATGPLPVLKFVIDTFTR
jgi:hypothetical protein